MIFYDVLTDAFRNHWMVSLHFDPSKQASCSLGYIQYFDNEWVLLESIGIDGANEGYELRKTEELYRVSLSGKYIDKISILHSNYSKVKNNVQLAVRKCVTARSILCDIISQIAGTNAIVTIWTEDSDDSIIGQIVKFTNNMVQIQEVDDFGEYNEIIYLKVDCIKAIDISSRKCQVLEFLCSQQHRQSS